MKILLVEDDASMHEVVSRSLRQEGYLVESAMDYDSASSKIGSYVYDCILLDIGLPGGSGFDLLKQIRSSQSGQNVIMISARDSVDDKIHGLELGADDYLAKPFHLAELSARIKSVVRRSMNSGGVVYKAGNVEIAEGSNRVTVGGKEISLLKKEFDILKYFLMRPGHLVDKAVLAEAVWGDHADQSDDFQYVYAQMKNLRRKLSEAGADIEIKSVYGFGYRLKQEMP